MAAGAWKIGAFMALLSIAMPAVARRDPPYWVSISASAAMLRAGPGTNFPATWRYVRPGLPLRVVQIHADWRRVVDPDGAEGWIRSNLLSDKRTGMVIGGIQPLRAAPDGDSRIEWRAEPGVVGRLTRCADGWCRFDVHGRIGYVDARGLWGVAPNETFD